MVCWRPGLQELQKQSQQEMAGGGLCGGKRPPTFRAQKKSLVARINEYSLWKQKHWIYIYIWYITILFNQTTLREGSVNTALCLFHCCNNILYISLFSPPSKMARCFPRCIPKYEWSTTRGLGRWRFTASGGTSNEGVELLSLKEIRKFYPIRMVN